MVLEKALCQTIDEAVSRAVNAQLDFLVERIKAVLISSATAAPNDPSKADPWLTRKEAAAHLRLSPVTLAIWHTEKRGPRVYHMGKGQAVRYRLSELNEYLEQNAGLVGRKGRPPKQEHLRETNHAHVKQSSVNSGAVAHQVVA